MILKTHIPRFPLNQFVDHFIYYEGYNPEHSIDRFLPDGTGIVYLERIPSLNFSFFDIATRTSRPLTRLSNQGALRTFDITPDGKYIVFDRSRQNSNIVLIDLPK